jgi:sugar phosphate isomerase/epimerase
MSERVERPLQLEDVIADAVSLGVDVVQLCDRPELESFTDHRLGELRAQAVEANLLLEVGTRGIAPAHLTRYLDLAGQLDARLVRSMVPADQAGDLSAAADLLRGIGPAYAAAGVELALETYEQIPTADLVDLVARTGVAGIGVCLDLGNTVAGYEQPSTVIEIAAPHTLNVHVKDYRFTRAEGWVGFSFTGAPLGEGALDVDRLCAEVRAHRPGVSFVIEHWLPWQGDPVTTTGTERDWTARAARLLDDRRAAA